MSRKTIPLISEDYKLITGAMPTIDPDRVKQSQKAITKRIKETFNLNRQKLEAIHEEHRIQSMELARKNRMTMPRWQTAYKTFKNTVMTEIKSGKSVNNAIRATFNTDWFTPEAVRGRHNMWTVLRRDKDLFSQLRRYSGWNVKMSPDKLRWDVDEKMYWYGDNVSIKKITSPKKGVGNVEIQITKYLDTFTNGQRDIAKQENFSYDADLWEAMKAGI